MQKIDLTGHQYGDWKVLRESDVRKSKKVYWECQCTACGKTQLCSGNNLRTGKTTNCGCKLAEKRSAIHLHDLTGKRFGYLTVLRRAKEAETYGRTMWLCQCDCGTQTIVAGEHLEHCETLSCGCCKYSKGERKISDLLNQHNIPYDPHHYVKIDGKRYYYDFFVNNTYFIEYDGEQHYNGWHRDPDNLEWQRQQDAIKTKYCVEQNIPLIRVPYTQYKTLSINDLILKEKPIEE